MRATVGVEPLLAPGRTPHHPALSERFAAAPPAPENPTPLEAMLHRLAAPAGKKLYAQRKHVPEPVLGKLAALPADLGRPQTMLADNGYFSAANVEHLEILGAVLRRDAGVVPRVDQAHAFQRLLLHAIQHFWRGDAGSLVDCRHDVVGMSMSWPAHIKDKGGLRSQFCHVIVAIYKDGWMASTTPLRLPWVTIGSEPSPDDFKWELYNIDEDPSQANNIADKYPDKLKELQNAFDVEAK